MYSILKVNVKNKIESILKGFIINNIKLNKFYKLLFSN